MLGSPCIIVVTKSGFSARVVASHRPDVPIVSLTDSERTYRQLALVWGVIPELVQTLNSYEEMVSHGLVAAQQRGVARPGDRVVVTAGVPFGVAGTTNQMKVELV
jgi:pyruvate kinase